MSNSNPLVSIIIPVYNGANFLQEAIDSAINQTYKNIEIIVVNDGSNDNGKTEKIAQSYGDKIKCYNKKNGGVASALNLGIEKMSGEYFSWLSHDDLYLPEKIERQVEAIDFCHKNEVIVCRSDLIDKDRNILHSVRKNNFIGRKSGKQMFIDMFSHKGTPNGCALLIPKYLFDKCGKFNDLKYTQDVECWARMMIKKTSFLFIKESLVYTRIHGEQSQYKLSHLYKEELKLYTKMLVNFIQKYAQDKEYYLKTLMKFNFFVKNFDGIKYIKQKTNMKECLSCYGFYLKGIVYRKLQMLYHSFYKFKKI